MMTKQMTKQGALAIAKQIEEVINDSFKNAQPRNYSALPELEAYIMQRELTEQQVKKAKQEQRMTVEKKREAENSVRRLLLDVGLAKCPCCEMELLTTAFKWKLHRDKDNVPCTEVTLHCEDCEVNIMSYESWYDKPVANIVEFRQHLMNDFPTDDRSAQEKRWR